MNRFELFSNWVETRIESLEIKASVEKNQKVDGLEAISKLGLQTQNTKHGLNERTMAHPATPDPTTNPHHQTRQTPTT
jgi:hypothetical protein